MNSRMRISVQPTKSTSAHDKEKKVEKSRTEPFVPDKTGSNRLRQNREKKLALLQDVDKLKKKLRHEENVHRALERALTRPLGCLPRLPPYLPRYTLELLAEVAVLEEEIVRLEEQVMNFQHGLYQESVYISSKSNTEKLVNPMDGCPIRRPKDKRSNSLSLREFSPLTSITRSTSSRKLLSSGTLMDQSVNSSSKMMNRKLALKKPNSPPPQIPDDIRGKENHSFVNSAKDRHLLEKDDSKLTTPVQKLQSIEMLLPGVLLIQ